MYIVRRIIHNNKSSHSIHPGDRFRIDIIIFLFELYSNSRLKLGLNKSHQIKKHGRNILIIFIFNKNDLLFVFSRKFIRKQLGCHLTKCYRYWQAICSSIEFSRPLSLPSVGTKLVGIVFTMPLRQAMIYRGHRASLRSAPHTLQSTINFTCDILSSMINWSTPFGTFKNNGNSRKNEILSASIIMKECVLNAVMIFIYQIKLAF